MIPALHVNSTAPFSMRNRDKKYYMEDFDLLSTILSALLWRKYNGNIKLYTDSVGYDYYSSLGLLDLWDAGIDVKTLDNIPNNINQDIFWAAAKIFALQNEETPIAIMDTDLMIWNNITNELEGKEFVVLHREELNNGAYPPLETLKIRSGYNFDPQWDWSEQPCNMAFAYLSNPEFLKYYTACAIDFMTDNMEYPMELITQMVFAEQRIVSVCAKQMNIKIHHFLDDPFQQNNEIFSHLWGAKDIARNFPGQRKLICSAIVNKINLFFPKYYEKISEMEIVKAYETFTSE